MMNRFVFPRSFYESIRTFNPTQREALYSAIFGYMFDDTEPELRSVALKRVWMLIFPILSKAKKISTTKSEQYQNNVATMSEHSKDNVKTMSARCSFKEKEKEKDINKPPKSPKGYGEDFEKFWKEYPRHDAKQDAFRSFTKIIKDTTLDTLIKSVRAFKDTEGWQRDDGKYIPYASTWLNGRRWLDDLPANEPPKKKGAPYVTECGVCHSQDLTHSIDRYRCNTCNLIWDWNSEDERWEITL